MVEVVEDSSFWIGEQLRASANATPCFLRLLAAFRASHSNSLIVIRRGYHGRTSAAPQPVESQSDVRLSA
jgi:hypothetical protein